MMSFEKLSRIKFPDTHFMQLAGLAHNDAGLMIPRSKKSLVHSRLSSRLRKLSIPDFGEYYEFVTSPAGKDERKCMISALTTNVTSFFREDHHFTAFRKAILPELVKRARNGQPVRIWSAGCSSGQEAYSIAMILDDHIVGLANLDIKILATDIDANMIEIAKSGVYSENDVAGIPKAYRKKYLKRKSPKNLGKYIISNRIKKLITFKELNLLLPWPMKKQLDVIFCRNVVIYFDDQAQSALWHRFKNVLKPEGWLLIGHSERLGDDDLDGMQSAGITTYRKLRLAEHARKTGEKHGA